MKEFIQVEEIAHIQDQLRTLNMELMNALNHTKDVQDLMTEKNEIIQRASKISEMMLPEIQELNTFITGDRSITDTVKPTKAPKAPKAVRRGRPRLSPVVAKAKPKLKTAAKRGRPRKVRKTATKADSLDELKKNLADLRKQLSSV